MASGGSDSKTICCICKKGSEITSTATVVLPECGHTVHLKCIRCGSADTPNPSVECWHSDLKTKWSKLDVDVESLRRKHKTNEQKSTIPRRMDISVSIVKAPVPNPAQSRNTPPKPRSGRLHKKKS